MPQLGVGEHWQFEIKLKPPWGAVNFQGPDKERWLFAQGIGGVGTVRTGQRTAAASGIRFAVNRVRARVIHAVSEKISDQTRRGVIQALATADRSQLDASDRNLLAATGTAHLLAISGLHVGLATAGGMWLCRLLLLLLPFAVLGRASLALTVGCGLLSAFFYAALAGFGIPTLRSVLMLLTVLIAVMMCRSIHPARAWTISLAAILIIDPFAALGAGLWFSFLAVAALIWIFQPRSGALAWWKTMLMAQSAVILVLMPVGVAWFGVFSPSGFVANLLAIPWVSFFIVPPVLAGIVALPFSDLLVNVLWNFAGFAISALFSFLTLIQKLQGQVLFLSPATLFQALLALVGAVIILLPRGLPIRWLGIFLVVPLFLPPGPRSRDGVVSLEILDVGQGTAVLATSGRYSLLYDSGPGDGADQNFVAPYITPALARVGRNAPEQVVISHGDLDHAGGLGTLLHRYPRADYRANLGERDKGLRGCTSPSQQYWPGVTVRTLHPSPWLPYLGNDSSCVVSMEAVGGRILLSGDISKAVESRLLADGVDSHKILLVPHHGSNTSSSQAFIDRIGPEVAIATASLGNRFGFPRAEIRERYVSMGSLFWSTGECGAIRVVLGVDGALKAESARRHRNRVWRWPAASNCP
jgi:competence protein ComEC